MAKPMPTTSRGQQTRDRVVQAAVSLMRAQGVAAVTLDDVQALAGVGRSQLYHYFEDRDDLIRAVVAAAMDRVLADTADLLAALDTFEGIDRWFAHAEVMCAAGRGAGGCPIGSLVAQLSERDQQARLALADAFTRWQAPLVDGLKRMQSRGQLHTHTEVGALADSVMAAMQGGLLLAQVRRDPDQLHRALDAARAALAAAAVPPDHDGPGCGGADSRP